MTEKNALSPRYSTVDERYEAAQRNNNYLRETPVEKPRQQGIKWKARPTGGLIPSGFKISGKLDF